MPRDSLYGDRDPLEDLSRLEARYGDGDLENDACFLDGRSTLVSLCSMSDVVAFSRSASRISPSEWELGGEEAMLIKESERAEASSGLCVIIIYYISH